ncbi:GNAT family N-acetyltransferase [Nocardia fluminea]|uniref:hypothetical protein n=1 Tax=Nocardia fluminea TaxID=134984 RepID=UPI00342DB6FA
MTAATSNIVFRELRPTDRAAVLELHADPAGPDGCFRFFGPPPENLDRVVGSPRWAAPAASTGSSPK